MIEVGNILAMVSVVALLFMAWNGRRHAPGVDRALVNEFGKVKNRVAKIEADLNGCATKVDIAALTGKIEALEEHAASAGDINALEGKVNTALAKIEGVEKAADRTEAGVQRIEGYLMQRGIDR